MVGQGRSSLRCLNRDIRRPSGFRPAQAPPGAGGRARAINFLAFALIWRVLCSFCAGAQEISAATNLAPPAAVPALPASVDLRPVFEKWGFARRTQGKRGTCSVFAVVGALEFAAARQQRHSERFSVEFLNWAANRIVGENQDGGFFSDLWRAFAAYGICSEKTFPYRAAFDPALAPTPEAVAEARRVWPSASGSIGSKSGT